MYVEAFSEPRNGKSDIDKIGVRIWVNLKLDENNFGRVGAEEVQNVCESDCYVSVPTIANCMTKFYANNFTVACV